MAKPGYGKRNVPGQAVRRKGEFEHLPVREASIAAYLDRLPEGAAMDVKTLAKHLPRYGQQAVASALVALTRAGHLRRLRVPLGEGLTQWVFHTYFSRTARDRDWWLRFLSGDVPPEEAAAVPAARSEAYGVLAQLGVTDGRLLLSAAECAALEELAAQWLARGITPAQLLRAVSAGLPDQVHSPGAFVRRRLRDKMPPSMPVRAAVPEASRRQVLVECAECGAPGLPELLPDGLCKGCRGGGDGDASGGAGAAVAAEDVRRRVAALRGALHH
ncbi:hypothetical protein J7I98_31575 [Streptomyces sp. ISL-98]|nr:hypothetical protein [Streptomyces sp. ISL-98]